MLKYDAESYRWIFAACETVRLWNAYDRFLVEKARTKEGLNSDEVKKFAYNYQTSRATDETSREKTNSFILNNKSLSPREIYKSIVENEICMTSKGVMGCVFASKLIWFYRPSEWIMHDRFSIIGLKEVSHTKIINNNNYHDEFNKNFKQEELVNIRLLLKSLDITYEFESRIADKYLMSAGQDIASPTQSPKPLDQIDWCKWVIDRHKGPNANIDDAMKIAAKLPRMRG